MTETNEPTLKDRNLRFVVLKAIVDAGAAELGNLRDEHLPALLAAYRSTEASSFKVRAPGVNGAPGPVVATVSLSVPKPKMEIHDQEEFLDWVQTTHPDLVEVEVIPAMPEHTVVVPATEERTERRLDPKAWATMVKHFDQAEEGGIVDSATGVMVDGVIVNPGGDPKSFAVKYEAGAADQLLASYRAGRLDEVVAGTSLAAIAPSEPMVERRLVEPVEAYEARLLTELEADPAAWPGDAEEAPAPVAPVDGEVGHAYDLRTHYPPHGPAHLLRDCPGRGCPSPAETALGEDVPVRYGQEVPPAALDLVDASTHGRLNGVPLATDDEPFDPGDWGAPSHAADPWR